MLKNSKAFSIMEVLVATGLISILTLAVSTLVTDLLKQQSNAQLVSSVNSTKLQLAAMIQDDRAWLNTIGDTTINNDSTTRLGCMRGASGTACPATGGPFPFVPIGSNSQLLFGSYNPIANPSQGFDKNGALCNGYSATTGNNNCQYRYTFSWTPMCPTSGACISPQAKIDIVFEHSPGTGFTRLSTTKNSLSVIRGLASTSYAFETCELLKGVYDPATQTCTMPYDNYTCPSGEAIIGFATDLTPKCEKILKDISCATSGTLMIGFDSDGNPTCGNPYKNTDCSSTNQVVVGFDNSGSPICGVPAPVSGPPPVVPPTPFTVTCNRSTCASTGTTRVCTGSGSLATCSNVTTYARSSGPCACPAPAAAVGYNYLPATCTGPTTPAYTVTTTCL